MITIVNSPSPLWGGSGRGYLVAEQASPALFDVLRPVDGEGEYPGHHKGADDDKPQEAKIKPADGIPEPPGEMQLLDHDLAELDEAHEKGHEDRQPGDRQVVKDLPNRVRKGPGIGAGHEGSIGGVHQRHARGKDQRQRDDRVERQVLRGGARRDGQEGDFRRGVESEPEEKTDRVHLPAPGDELEEASEYPGQQAAVDQLVVERVAVRVPGVTPADERRDMA